MADLLLFGRDPEGRAIPLESQYRLGRLAGALADAGHHVDVLLPLSESEIGPQAWAPAHLLPPDTVADESFFLRYAVVIVSLELYPYDLRFPVPLVVNLQGPLFAVGLPPAEQMDALDGYWFSRRLAQATDALRRGDFFICSGERQRLFSLGMLGAVGRINNLTVADAERLIGIVSPGVIHRPEQTGPRPGPDGRRPALLWMSGVYPWYEPLAALEGFRLAALESPDMRLIFAGAANPTAEGLCRENLVRLHESVREHGLENKVSFLPWRPLSALNEVYADVCAAICLYRPSIETQVSWRGRVVELLGAGLPVILTGGDDIAEMVRAYNAGLVLGSNDPAVVATAIQTMLTDTGRRARMADNVRRLVVERLDWRKNIACLDSFCRAPDFARDQRNPALQKNMRLHLPIRTLSALPQRLYLKYQIWRQR